MTLPDVLSYGQIWYDRAVNGTFTFYNMVHRYSLLQGSRRCGETRGDCACWSNDVARVRGHNVSTRVGRHVN